MDTLAISNIKELQTEIERVSVLQTEQQAMLESCFNTPAAVFASVRTLFNQTGKNTIVFNRSYPDIVSLASRIILPFLLNKTLFRHSNFIVKMLVGFLSQKMSGYITTNSVKVMIEKGKWVLDKWTHKIVTKDHQRLIPSGNTLHQNSGHEQV